MSLSIAMAKSNIEQKINELRGTDRVFQIDRDTFVVYTGMHPEDMRPFIRVGAGKAIPRGILRNFENVLLTENDPLNVGLEMAWLHATLSEGEETIRYVGSKDRVAQVYSFTGMRELDDSNRHVEIVPYKMANLETRRDRSTITFFETGNAIVQVGNSKTYDHVAHGLERISLDREYDLLTKALKKRERRCESGRSFLYLGGEAQSDPNRPPVYWNFDGRGLFLNPCVDPHYALFENAIDADRLDMAISYSPFSVGLGEVLRRKNTEQRNVGMYQADEERNALFKKIYRDAKLQPFGDSSSLPMAKDTGYFVSKGGSHGLFAYRIGPQADRMVQLVFPLGGGKFSRTFDFLKAPHDLEMHVVNTPEDLTAGQGRITLQVPGKIAPARFEKARLAAHLTPLVPGREYRLNQSEDPAALAENVLNAFADTPIHEMVRDIVFLHMGLDFTEGNLNRALEDLRRRPLPKEDLAELFNLRQLLSYLQMTPIYRQSYTPQQRKQLERLMDRYDPKRFHYSDWLALGQGGVEYHLLFTPRRALQFVKRVKAEPAQLRVPPPFAVLERDPKAYAKNLREWNRAADKSGDAGGFRNSIETLERLYEEKLRIIGERKRFQELLNDLGIVNQGAAAEEKSTNGRWSKRRSWEPRPEVTGVAAAGNTLNGMHGANGKRGGSTRGGSGFSGFSGMGGAGRAAAFIVAAAALIGLGVLLFSSVRASSLFNNSGEISMRGNSEAEQRAVDLAGPNSLQPDEKVPGEDSVEATNEEILGYANLLAVRNNFARLNGGGGANLRNPNLVFPGDVLFLPDGRRSSVAPGQYIWEIAETLYRKDRARFMILDRQISTLLSENAGNISTEVVSEIEKRRGLMQRLAVTKDLKRLLVAKDREIEAQLQRK